MIDPVSRIGNLVEAPTPQNVAPASKSFSAAIGDLIGEVNGQVVNADRQVQKLAVGEADSLHHVLISLEEAKVSLGLVVQVRNRLVDAYQELLRMQI